MTYSSAVCERDERPGPIFTDGNGIKAWSDRVGDPKGTRPDLMAFCTKGCFSSIREELRRNERASALQEICYFISANNSSLEYSSLHRTSNTTVHRSGTTLCCVPALITVTLIFTGPSRGDSFLKR